MNVAIQHLTKGSALKTIQFNKLPSVTREGKYFYRGQTKAGHWITIQQDWFTGLWQVNHNGVNMDGYFATAKEAMSACQPFIGKLCKPSIIPA